MKELLLYEPKRMKNFKETANFIWSIADLLRGDYKQSDYGKVVLHLFKSLKMF